VGQSVGSVGELVRDLILADLYGPYVLDLEDTRAGVGPQRAYTGRIAEENLISIRILHLRRI
jgi:hypothetical protein